MVATLNLCHWPEPSGPSHSAGPVAGVVAAVRDGGVGYGVVPGCRVWEGVMAGVQGVIWHAVLVSSMALYGPVWACMGSSVRSVTSVMSVMSVMSVKSGYPEDH